MTYHMRTYALIVKPDTEPIYSELATIVQLEDEAGGPFVAVMQSGKVNPAGENRISITTEEWPLIRDAIDQMMQVAEELSLE